MSPVNKKVQRPYRRVTAADKTAVLDTVRHWYSTHGRSPTYRDIGHRLDLSQGTVQRIVEELEAEGRLERKPGARGFFIPGSITDIILGGVAATVEAVAPHVPILGYAAAGQPIEAVDSDPDTLALPSEWCQRPSYLLRVRGDSMIGDGIHDGDLVLVEATDHVQTGAIHVCWLPGDGATLKRVKTKADAAELVASNTAFAPIPAPHGTIVQGRVVWVLRHMAAKKKRRRT